MPFSFARLIPRPSLSLGVAGVVLVSLALWSHASPQSESEASGVYARIKASLDAVWIVDTHEHLRDETVYLKTPPDFFARMRQYVNSDQAAAGLSWSALARIQDATVPVEERVPLFLEYWQFARTTGYGRALKTAVQNVYGFDIDQLAPGSYRDLNSRIAAANHVGLYRHVLKDMAHIELAIVEGPQRFGPDHEFFRSVIRLDSYVLARDNAELDRLGAQSGVSIRSLDDLLHALETEFTEGVNGGIVGLKAAIAYRRSLRFPPTTRADAEAAFRKLLAKPPPAAAGPLDSFDPDLVPLQNFLMHRICQLAADAQLPIQVHTGLQTGPDNDVSNADPTLLVPLFHLYPKVKFILLHTYPYAHQAVALAKNFPNVYLDMTWLYVVSPDMAGRVLGEWIESVPANKILGFGGDYNYPEGTYAHAKMARETMATVLARKVAEGYFTEREAVSLGRRLLRTNAIDAYKLPLKP